MGQTINNSYVYDANGNQTTRTINGQNYPLGYDAEGRLVSVSGPSYSAAFTYNGDGQRVKQVINPVRTSGQCGETTYFVGNYYEQRGGEITKYYYAGVSDGDISPQKRGIKSPLFRGNDVPSPVIQEEVRMLRKEDYRMIETLKKRGVYLKDIAEELGVHPKTVQRALKRGSAPVRERQVKASKLELYKASVDRLLSEEVWNAHVILREIQKEGYAGSYTILREYVQPKRPLRGERATVRYETKPGEQLQSDWGEAEVEIAGQATKVHFMVNQLGYSRRFHFWCTDSEDAEHTYEGLICSFEYFGGVSAEVLVDNQKSAVLKASNNGHPIFNERFVDLAAHYGFSPKACKPYRARTKGKDERMVGYIKHNFFVRYRHFESWAHLNQLAELWLREEADQRLHGTVREVVAERFEREKPCLQPLPEVRYDTSYLEFRQASWDCYIEVRGNRYSVPAEWAGQPLMVRIGLDDRLRVFHAEQLVAQHSLQSKQDGWCTVPEHHAALWEAVKVEPRALGVYEEVL